jgi:azurin
MIHAWKFATGFLLTSSLALAAPASTTKLDLTTGTAKDKEAMAFNPTTLKVKPGAKVALTFKNASASKGMTHNFVLTQPGKAQQAIDGAVSPEKGGGPDNGWVPTKMTDVIITHTKLIDAGESVTLEFTAPTTPGDYPYVCTFPGHSTMRGVLKVAK